MTANGSLRAPRLCTRRARGPLSCPGRASVSERRPGIQELHGTIDGQLKRPVVSPLGPGSRGGSGRAPRGPGARPGHERDARPRRVRSRGARSEPLAVIPISRCQTACVSSFPRRVAAPGFSLFLSRPPKEGWAERRQAHYFVCRVRETRRVRTRRGAARPMTRDARLSALHRGDFRPGAALPSPALPPDPCSELLAARSSPPGGRCSRTSRARGYEPRPQDATPRSAFRIVSGDAPP